MKTVLLLAALASASATADTPGLQYKVICDGANIVVLIKATENGIYRMDIPAALCGKFI